jgi:hypothetical protein
MSASCGPRMSSICVGDLRSRSGRSAYFRTERGSADRARSCSAALSHVDAQNAESGALTPASIRPPDPLAIAVTGNGRAPVSRGRAPATIAKRRQSFGRRPPIAAKLEGWSRHPRAAAAHSGTITTDVLPTTTGR